MFITETWFTDFWIASLSNYYLCRKDRLTWIRVCIYIRNDLNSTYDSDLKLNKILSQLRKSYGNVLLCKKKIFIRCINIPQPGTNHKIL